MPMINDRYGNPPAITLCDCSLPAACGRPHVAPFFTVTHGPVPATCDHGAVNWRSDAESARLHPADLEAIARRVAELLRGAP